jgi:hypothetical protein
MTTATVNFDQPTLFKSPGRLAAPDTTRLGRSVLPHCPGPAVGVGNDDPHRRPRSGGMAPRSTNRARVEPAATVAHADDARGGPTLDDLLSAAWDGLAAHSSVTCPVCSGSMAPRYGSGPQPVGGRCKRCGSTLG